MEEHQPLVTELLLKASEAKRGMQRNKLVDRWPVRPCSGGCCVDISGVCPVDLNANGCSSGADGAFSAASPCSKSAAALVLQLPCAPLWLLRGPPLAPAERRKPPLDLCSGRGRPGAGRTHCRATAIVMHQAFSKVSRFSVALARIGPRDAKCFFFTLPFPVFRLSLRPVFSWPTSKSRSASCLGTDTNFTLYNYMQLSPPLPTTSSIIHQPSAISHQPSAILFSPTASAWFALLPPLRLQRLVFNVSIRLIYFRIHLLN